MRCLAIALVALLFPASAGALTSMGAYKHDWQQLSRFYGAKGQPAPLLRIRRGAIPEVQAGPTGIRQVTLSPWDVKGLRARNPKTRRFAEKTLAHEFAHVYQSSEILGEGDAAVPWAQRNKELLARQFAGNVMRRFDLKAAKGTPRAKKIRRKINPLDTSQFGSNFGQNPRTIIWPSSPAP